MFSLVTQTHTCVRERELEVEDKWIEHMQVDELPNLFSYSMPMSPRMEKLKADKDSSNDTHSVWVDGSKLLGYDSYTSTFYLECLTIKVLEGS